MISIKNWKSTSGFALIEVLIALVIISVILLAIFSGVSAGIQAVRDSDATTHAMLIARTKMNEFISNRMRGTDLKEEPLKMYPGYTLSRVTKRHENIILGPINAKITQITVHWLDGTKTKQYNLNYIYPVK